MNPGGVASARHNFVIGRGRNAAPVKALRGEVAWAALMRGGVANTKRRLSQDTATASAKTPSLMNL